MLHEPDPLEAEGCRELAGAQFVAEEVRTAGVRDLLPVRSHVLVVVLAHQDDPGLHVGPLCRELVLYLRMTGGRAAA